MNFRVGSRKVKAFHKGNQTKPNQIKKPQAEVEVKIESEDGSWGRRLAMAIK